MADEKNDDIFEDIARLEKRADEMVARARQDARKLRKDVDAKLKDLADRLEKDYGKRREEIEAELAKRREKIMADLEEKMKERLSRLDAVRREKVEPLVQHVINAFLEDTDVD
jgi:BMFP domain-containing protein YqiC